MHSSVPERGSTSGALPVRPAVRLTYLFLLLIDAVAALVLVGFFLVGLGDGSVSSFNITLWLGLLALVALVLGGAIALARRAHPWLAIALLGTLAAPALAYAAFMLLLIILAPDWR